MRMRIRLATRIVQEMAVVVRVLLAALLGLYWSSSRVEGNHRFEGLHITVCYITQIRIDSLHA